MMENGTEGGPLEYTVAAGNVVNHRERKKDREECINGTPYK